MPAATILVFGDSLSAGYGLKPDEGWASLLAKRLKTEKWDYRVANASISGETTLGGRNRIEAALRAHRPAVVIVELGANDGLRGASVDAMRVNLEAIVDASVRARARVLLLAMRVPPNYGRDYAEKFRLAFADVAQRRKLPPPPFLLEGFSEKQEHFQPDGLHPNAEAQPIMLDTVWKVLRPILIMR